MRGSVVVLALAIMPFVSTMSKAQDPSTSDTRTQCTKDPGNPSPSGDENRTKKCPVTPPPTTGKVTISGTLFFDVDHSGVLEADEVGIAGWYVVLTLPTGETMRYLTTDTGTFSFAGLSSGAEYKLCVEPSVGWTQTSPTSGASCLNSFGYTITVPALAVDTVIGDQNFGFYSNTTF